MRATVLAFTILFVPGLGAAVIPGPQKAQKAQFFSNPVGLRSVHSAPSAALGIQAVPAYRGEWTADTRSTWRDDDGEPRVQFNLRTGAGDSRWGFGVRLRDLAGLPSAAIANMADNVQFTWTREAGTFRFTGSFDQGRGGGTYTFTPDQTFVTNMATAGYRNLATDDIVRLAVIDVTTAQVRGLAQAGYTNLPLDDLVRTRIHKATPEFVRELASLGYKSLPIEDLIKFRIHKVTPEYIRSMREVGFTAVSEKQLVKMRIHKVDAMFIRHAREDGLTVQTPGEAVDLAIHGPRFRRRR